MSKLTNMLAFFDKNKKKENNLDEIGLVMSDEEEQPSSSSKPQNTSTSQPQNKNLILFILN